MIKNTFRFWLMATLVLATVYLISNPTMASKVGSQASEIWQVVISKVVKIPELLATITPAEQEELANREQTVNPILEQPQQHRIDPKEGAVHQEDQKVGRDGKDNEETVQETQNHQSQVPEVKMEDVLTPLAEKPLAQASNGPAVGEEAIPLEVLREIYARHLEALKIIDSGVGNEQADK